MQLSTKTFCLKYQNRSITAQLKNDKPPPPGELQSCDLAESELGQDGGGSPLDEFGGRHQLRIEAGYEVPPFVGRTCPAAARTSRSTRTAIWQ